jgi:cyclase
MADLQETRIRDNVIVWTLGGETIRTAYGTNATAVIGEDGVLLIDPLIAPAYGHRLAQTVRAYTEAPVRFVVFTHHHTDHSWGAAPFEDEGAVLIGHRECRERMLAEHPDLVERRRAQEDIADLFADARPVPPAITFDEGLVLHVGGIEVEVWHPGAAHTPGDAFLFLPEERVAVCGDLVFSGYHYNYEDASPDGVRAGLRALESLDADSFIPGHGSAAGPELLRAQLTYHDAVRDLVAAGVEAGKEDTVIVEEIRARFPDYRLSLVLPTTVARLRGGGP